MRAAAVHSGEVKPGASCELYVDKAVKFISGLLQLMLGLVLVILSHVQFLGLALYQNTAVFVTCQALSLLLILLLWFWCYGEDLASHVQELMFHVNHLTNQYKRYSEGVARGPGNRGVSEVTLHADLDNYLEYFLYLLMTKGEKLFIRHLVKWILILIVSLLWLIVIVAVVVTLPKTSTPVYFQVLLVLSILILAGSVVLVAFHIAYDLCKVRSYQLTFFYRAVPGTLDARLKKLVAEYYNPRYVWLLSRHCWHNSRLILNAGLAKSLARKYSYVSSQHRSDHWRDQHFPTLMAEQVERFRFSSEKFVQSGHRGDRNCCYSLLWCGLDTPNDVLLSDQRQSLPPSLHSDWKKRTSHPSKVGVADGADVNGIGSPRPGHLHPFSPSTEDGYMTPNLFVRKLAREACTPEQLLDEEMNRKHTQGARLPRTRPSKLPQDDSLHDVPCTGPDARDRNHGPSGTWLSRDDTEINYGAFYQPFDPNPHRMQREYDPLTYGVRMHVKKEMAKDVKAWR